MLAESKRLAGREAATRCSHNPDMRSPCDAAHARAALMERLWPARDMAPLIALIADPHRRQKMGLAAARKVEADHDFASAAATIDRRLKALIA